MKKERRAGALLLRALELLGYGMMAAGMLTFLFLSTPANRNADCGEPLKRHGLTTFNNRLYQSKEGCLFSYQSHVCALNVYGEDGAFLCSYRIPNRGRGASEMSVCMGDVYIEVYRGGGMHRYGGDGAYLGRMSGGILFDAQGNMTARFPHDSGWEVLGFAETRLCVRSDGAYYWVGQGGGMEPIDLVSVPVGTGGYYLRWTTLYRADGAVVDASPFYMVLLAHPFAAWGFAVLGAAVSQICMRLQKKLRRASHKNVTQ